jgi:3-hydroxyisobutyrate dehydrogenase-like beta-hydroxyacid dehydrogenase
MTTIGVVGLGAMGGLVQARAALLCELPENAWFDVAMMQKDLRLALDQGHDEGVPMPSTTVADQMLSTTRAAGYEHHDIAVVFRMLSDLVTVPPGRPLVTVAA